MSEITTKGFAHPNFGWLANMSTKRKKQAEQKRNIHYSGGQENQSLCVIITSLNTQINKAFSSDLQLF